MGTLKEAKEPLSSQVQPQLRDGASVSPHMVGDEGKGVDHVVFAKVYGRK